MNNCPYAIRKTIVLAMAIACGTTAFVATASAASPSDADWAKADEIVQAIQLPKIPARDYVITDFGAKPDGQTDALPAIKAAIKKASSEGGGRVVIPKGDWLSKTLSARRPHSLGRHRTLQLLAAHLRLRSPRRRHHRQGRDRRQRQE